MCDILVVDDHSVFRAGLRGAIEARFPQSRVVESPKLSWINSSKAFDLILVDSESLNYETLDVLAELHEANPTTCIAVMLTSKARTDVLYYLSAGFHGVVHKLQPEAELFAAISDLLSGRIYVPGWVAEVDDANLNRPTLVDADRKP